MRLWGILAAIAVIAAPASAEEVTDYDRFRLWNNCEPMRLIVEDLNNDAVGIGLTQKNIAVTARSRLRAARLYNEDPALSILYIRISVIDTVRGGAYDLEVDFLKAVIDASLNSSLATTLKTSGIGTFGKSGGSEFIISHLSQSVDKFIDEYLRVNDEACRKPRESSAEEAESLEDD